MTFGAQDRPAKRFCGRGAAGESGSVEVIPVATNARIVELLLRVCAGDGTLVVRLWLPLSRLTLVVADVLS
jgi:hypothetical protein